MEVRLPQLLILLMSIQLHSSVILNCTVNLGQLDYLLDGYECEISNNLQIHERNSKIDSVNGEYLINTDAGILRIEIEFDGFEFDQINAEKLISDGNGDEDSKNSQNINENSLNYKNSARTELKNNINVAESQIKAETENTEDYVGDSFPRPENDEDNENIIDFKYNFSSNDVNEYLRRKLEGSLVDIENDRETNRKTKNDEKNQNVQENVLKNVKNDVNDQNESEKLNKQEKIEKSSQEKVENSMKSEEKLTKKQENSSLNEENETKFQNEQKSQQISKITSKDEQKLINVGTRMENTSNFNENIHKSSAEETDDNKNGPASTELDTNYPDSWRANSNVRIFIIETPKRQSATHTSRNSSNVDSKTQNITNLSKNSQENDKNSTKFTQSVSESEEDKKLLPKNEDEKKNSSKIDEKLPKTDPKQQNVAIFNGNSSKIGKVLSNFGKNSTNFIKNSSNFGKNSTVLNENATKSIKNSVNFDNKTTNLDRSSAISDKSTTNSSTNLQENIIFDDNNAKMLVNSTNLERKQQNLSEIIQNNKNSTKMDSIVNQATNFNKINLNINKNSPKIEQIQQNAAKLEQNQINLSKLDQNQQISSEIEENLENLPKTQLNYQNALKTQLNHQSLLQPEQKQQNSSKSEQKQQKIEQNSENPQQNKQILLKNDQTQQSSFKNQQILKNSPKNEQNHENSTNSEAEKFNSHKFNENNQKATKFADNNLKNSIKSPNFEANHRNAAQPQSSIKIFIIEPNLAKVNTNNYQNQISSTQNFDKNVQKATNSHSNLGQAPKASKFDSNLGQTQKAPQIDSNREIITKFNTELKESTNSNANEQEKVAFDDDLLEEGEKAEYIDANPNIIDYFNSFENYYASYTLNSSINLDLSNFDINPSNFNDFISNLTELTTNFTKNFNFSDITSNVKIKLPKIPSISINALITYNNTIHFLPINIHDAFKNLKLLAIIASELKEIRQIEIKHFPELHGLWLQYNHIETIEWHLFDFNPKLKELILMENRIKFINSDAFAAIEHLEQLDLIGNVCVNELAATEEDVTKLLENLSEKCEIKENFDEYYVIAIAAIALLITIIVLYACLMKVWWK